jgi:hypothetical protein
MTSMDADRECLTPGIACAIALVTVISSSREES